LIFVLFIHFEDLGCCTNLAGKTNRQWGSFSSLETWNPLHLLFRVQLDSNHTKKSKLRSKLQGISTRGSVVALRDYRGIGAECVRQGVRPGSTAELDPGEGEDALFRGRKKAELIGKYWNLRGHPAGCYHQQWEVVGLRMRRCSWCFVAHRPAPTHPRSTCLGAELARSKTPQAWLP